MQGAPFARRAHFLATHYSITACVFHGLRTPPLGGSLHMRRRRVLISASGPRGSVLKVRPPLSFSLSDADRMLENLEVVLAGELH